MGKHFLQLSCSSPIAYNVSELGDNNTAINVLTQGMMVRNKTGAPNCIKF